MITVLKVIEIIYHPNDGLNQFYACHFRVRRANGTAFITATFDIHVNWSDRAGQIVLSSVRVIDTCCIGNKYNGAEYGEALNKFFAEKGVTLLEYKKKIDNY